MESGGGGGGGGGGRAGLQQAAAAAAGGGCGWLLLEARLQGGAPWGFTLQGGLEHGEPLIISKIEEGGKADSLERPLQVGDEIIIINEIELTGYRQEAIALVKGSYKTLQITVRREFDPGYIEEFPALPPPSPPLLSSPTPTPPPSPPPPPPPPPPPQPSPHHNTPCSAGGVQLRIKNRRSEPASRPHSWHSTKLSEVQQDLDQRGMESLSSAWHHGYHASASTTDLSGGFEPGGSYLRKSPDQYSSRGSMDSLDPPHSSHLHSGAQHHHQLSHHGHGGPHPAYSSCHQLSSARSSNSIDHLHNKRDSAYSSFSTSSSIPEYLASVPSLSPERSYSLERVGGAGGSGDIQQADMRYIRTVYNAQQGLPQEQELSSASSLRGRGRDHQVGGVCYRGSSSSSSSGSSSGVLASNRHSVGPIWAPATSHSSYESLKGAPAPPRRSDSYAAIRNHERPNSWSSVEHSRSLRSLQKGSWHHSSGPVASGSAKGSYGAEGQLHTVIEKSPESSPTTKPRQGGPTPGPAGPPPQPSRLILPTGVYPVPQPEPHYAQMPSSGPAPSSSSGVYPALAKDGGRHQPPGPRGGAGREEEHADGWRDGRTTAAENGYQMNSSSSPHHQSSASAPASSQLRTQEMDRNQQEDSRFGYSRPHSKAGGGSEGQSGAQKPQNHQGPSNQRAHNQAPHHQMFPDQNQDPHSAPVQVSPTFRPHSAQELRDPYTTVQSRGDHSRSADQSNVHPEQHAPPRMAQSQTQAPPGSAPQQLQQWEQRERDRDREHPLTRLEIALAEVQRSSSPHSDGGHGPTRSLSVLEKVSRFERREHAGKQRSHSTSHSHSKPAHHRNLNQGSEKVRSGPCGAEDLRNMLERSTSGNKAHRTMSYRAGNGDATKNRTPADPSSALQRSRSSFHLDDSRDGNRGKDFPWRQDEQEMLGSLQDTSYSRSYRDSLKDAQSKVLRSTSFRRRDLNSSMSPPLASNHQPPTVPLKHQPSEKKGPKTMPKPQGIVIAPQPPPAPPPLISPHTPKERHVVGPVLRGPSPPALPSIPPVGHPALMRICGRKRLTADQKKRSFSEPENMNEIGVSDAETAALFRLGGETSVADRRKIFELGALQNAISRPDLRQLQQDALAEYVERKRGVRRDEGGGSRRGPRPRSAYMQPEINNHAGSSYQFDTVSLSSTSSLLSLQDSGLDRSFSLGGRRLDADLRSLQSNLFYPGRVTTPRPPAHSPHSSGSPPEQQLLQDFSAEGGFSRHTRFSSRGSDVGQRPQTAEPPASPIVSMQLNRALQRAGSTLSSGKSASAEDLLERSEDRTSAPQHSRSHSSPSVERLDQESPAGDARVFGVFVSGPAQPSVVELRSGDGDVSGGLAHPQPSQKTPDAVQQAASSPELASPHTQAPHRDRPRQRNSERQRVQSTSTLAASVGLPCPLSPAGGQGHGGAEWHASERLSQANLDAITFPGVAAPGDAAGPETTLMDKQSRHSLSDATLLEDTAKDSYRGRAFSLEGRGGSVGGSARQDGSAALTSREGGQRSLSTASSPPSSPHQSVQQRLPSLRISESGFFSSTEQPPPLQEEFDEVFMKNPAPLSSPPPPVQDSSVMEDFPPPPSPVLFESAGQQAVGSPTSEYNSIAPSSKSPLLSAPTSPTSMTALGQPPSIKPQSSTITSIPTSRFPALDEQEAEEDLGLEYLPLPKREKTAEERRVEALARQLVLKDRSLAPLLDTWGGKSTVELVEEIFPNSKLGEAPWQRRGSLRLDERNQDALHDGTQNSLMDQGTEIDMDEDEKDLDSKKVELCEALRASVAVLHLEKEALSEEQRKHQALGAAIDALVEERCKANEKDKYSMFIGDLEKIINLLLSLCSRLSRIDKALLALQREELSAEDAAEERESLNHKRSQLLRQTEDAWELKENLDRRQRVVHAALSARLSRPQLQDYRLFVSTKPSLLIRQRNLDDLRRRAEEQLTQLAESLPPELASAHGWSRGPLYSSPTPCSFTPLLPGPAHSARSTTVTSL